jgi:glycosyltransferase involved in cell wall biosynthesis
VKTRILCVSRTWSWGGAEKHTLDLLERLETAGVQSTILCLEADLYSSYMKGREHTKVAPFDGVKPATFFSYWKNFKRHRPEVIFFVKGWVELFPWHAFLAARLSGAKRVVTIEHLVADSPVNVADGGILSGVRRLVGHYARERWKVWLMGVLSHKTIAVSDAVRDKLIRDYGYSAEKTITIRNGVDLRRYRRVGASDSENMKEKLGLDVSDSIILCIANLNVQKRIDVLIHAVHILSKHHPRVRCVILGQGNLEPQLRRLAGDLNVADRVVFAGHVDDVRPYLEAADLLALSSDKEGLPLCLGEAMAYGIPCVATDVGGSKEIVVHGQTGLLVKPGSPEALAESIGHLLAHTEERSRMGAQALSRVRTHFDIEHAMGALQRQLMGDGKPIATPAECCN